MGATARQAWWVDTALSELRGARAGSCTRRRATAGWSACWSSWASTPTGSSRGRDASTGREVEGLDLREEPVLDHLRAVGAGVVVRAGAHGCARRHDGRPSATRRCSWPPGPSAPRRPAGGPFAVAAGLRVATRAPVEADLASGRPVAPGTWARPARAARVRCRGRRGTRGPRLPRRWRPGPMGGRRVAARPDEGRLRHAPLRPRGHRRCRSRPPAGWPSTWRPSRASRWRPTRPAPSTI